MDRPLSSDFGRVTLTWSIVGFQKGDVGFPYLIILRENFSGRPRSIPRSTLIGDDWWLHWTNQENCTIQRQNIKINSFFTGRYAWACHCLCLSSRSLSPFFQISSQVSLLIFNHIFSLPWSQRFFFVFLFSWFSPHEIHRAKLPFTVSVLYRLHDVSLSQCW